MRTTFRGPVPVYTLAGWVMYQLDYYIMIEHAYGPRATDGTADD